MTVTGGYPAPGPQDRARDGSQSAPPPMGPQTPPTGPRTPPTGPPTQPQGWMPQTPMLTAHKPGIVPLRPLQLGDILDGAVKAVRFNPKSMVGLSVLVLAVFLVPSAALGIGATHVTARVLSRFGPEANAFLGLPSSLFQTIATGLAQALLTGLLIHGVGPAVLGRKPARGPPGPPACAASTVT